MNNGIRTAVIPDDIRSKWQNIVDIIAEILQVPSAIITCVDPPQIEILLAARTPDNPYHEGDRAELSRHYCEWVIETRAPLRVTNAVTDPHWSNAPEIGYGLVAYLGYPICWPTGEVFGTICVLDRKENAFGDRFDRALVGFKEVVEGHLALLDTVAELDARNRRLLETEDRLRQALAEKEVLLREIHHRVKNNLNMVNGLIGLQAEIMQDPESRQLLHRLEGKIKTVSLMHERLYRSDSLKHVRLPDYLQDIVGYLFELSDPERVTVGWEIPPMDLDVELAIPLGMIVAELVSNSIKYAFPAGARGRLQIGFRRDGDSYLFAYADDGIGMPDSAKGSLGMRLTELFAKQLGGRLERTLGKGTGFRIRSAVRTGEPVT